MLREPPPNELPELRELPNEPRLLPNELPELRLLPVGWLLFLLDVLVVERCVCQLLRPLPDEDLPLPLELPLVLGVKVELGRLPNELPALPEGCPTVVRVLLCREPKLELLRLFCGVLEPLPKLLFGTLEGRREPKLTRFP